MGRLLAPGPPTCHLEALDCGGCGAKSGSTTQASLDLPVAWNPGECICSPLPRLQHLSPPLFPLPSRIPIPLTLHLIPWHLEHQPSPALCPPSLHLYLFFCLPPSFGVFQGCLRPALLPQCLPSVGLQALLSGTQRNGPGQGEVDVRESPASCSPLVLATRACGGWDALGWVEDERAEG